MRSNRYLALTLVLLAGCRTSEPTSASKQSSSEALPTTTTTATVAQTPDPTTYPQSARPSRELMKDHFTAVVLVRDALIVGNLELAKWNARFLAEHEPDPAVTSWSSSVDHLREQAAKVSHAPTLEAAAAASTELALECGRCHTANGVMPAVPNVDHRVAASGPRPHMLRHQWAAEQMWDGLIMPSEAHWNDGVAQLSDAPLGQEEIFANATATPALTKLASEVHALGAEGRKATTWNERAAVYGRLLATCAACHAGTSPVPQ